MTAILQTYGRMMKREAGMMTMEKLEKSIEELRSQPLRLICRTPKGTEQIMTPEECRRTGSYYIRVVIDELDKLLDEELEGTK